MICVWCDGELDGWTGNWDGAGLMRMAKITRHYSSAATDGQAIHYYLQLFIPMPFSSDCIVCELLSLKVFPGANPISLAVWNELIMTISSAFTTVEKPT